MKIIQSFWSKPIREGVDVPVENARWLGWPDVSYYYMCWAFSCLRLKEVFGAVELYTDQPGHELLVEKLALPYARVTTALDGLSRYDARWDGLARLYTYALQEEPFLHVDQDVFVSEALFGRFGTGSRLAVLHADQQRVYRKIIGNIREVCTHVPPWLEAIHASGSTASVNTALVGGSDHAFFRRLSDEAFRFVEQNESSLHQVQYHPKYINRVFERVLFHHLSAEAGIAVRTYLDGVNPRYDGLGALYRFPAFTPVVNLMDEFRRNHRVGEQLANRLLVAYPAYYYRIFNLLRCGEL